MLLLRASPGLNTVEFIGHTLQSWKGALGVSEHRNTAKQFGKYRNTTKKIARYRNT